MFKIIRTYLVIITISILIGVYFFEFFLLNNLHKKTIYKEYERKTGKKYDERNKAEVFFDLKKDNAKVVVDMPTFLWVDNKNIMPLSGISNSYTIFCNENGYYSNYISDRYGFNNPDEEWNKTETEFVLVGDSFVQGACVNRPNDIASNLRKKNNNVLNLGYETNGPLSQLASLKEFLPKNTKNIIWFFYEGNDLNDLEREKNSNILSAYLNKKTFSQGLKNKQKEVDDFLKSKLLEFEEIYAEQLLDDNKIKYKILKFIRLDKTKEFLFEKNSLKNTDSGIKKNIKFDYTLFEKILLEAKEISEINNSNFYIVFLPWYYRYDKGLEVFSYKKIKKIVLENNINFIDIHESVFLKEKFPLKNFPFQKFGHYNTIGYNKVAEMINKIVINNE